MLDVFGTPPANTCNVQQFFQSGTWIKPRNASQAYIVLIGAGGGGRAGTSADGGGGGGSGAISTWFGSAIHLPDSMAVTVGVGGTTGVAGGSTALSAFVGGTSYTFFSAAGGGSGTAATTGGTGGAVLTANPFCAIGIFKLTAGVNGASGNSTAAITATLPISQGGGGAGASASVPGSITPAIGASLYPVVTNLSGNNPGGRGYTVFSPVFVAVGGGGGGTTTTVGATGGDGGIGSGGGGGGEDSAVAGRGGNGYAVIVSW